MNRADGPALHGCWGQGWSGLASHFVRLTARHARGPWGLPTPPVIDAYTRRFNRRHLKVGHLFKRHFEAIFVDSDLTPF